MAGPRPTGLFASTAGPSLRQPSGLSNPSSQHSSILAARVAAKKAELEDLQQLRDVSSALATQMETLNEKLETLRDGAEGLSFDGHGPILLPSLVAVSKGYS